MGKVNYYLFKHYLNMKSYKTTSKGKLGNKLSFAALALNKEHKSNIIIFYQLQKKDNEMHFNISLSFFIG